MGNKFCSVCLPLLHHVIQSVVCRDLYSVGRRLDDDSWIRPVSVVERYNRKSGSLSPCDFPLLDATNTTWSDLVPMLRRHMALKLKNVQHGGHFDPSRWAEGPFIKKYGQYLVRSNSARYDPATKDTVTTVNAYMERARSSNQSVVAIGYNLAINQALLRSHGFELPQPLQDFDARPVVQLAATSASGTQLHRHMETWLALLHGKKAWWIAPHPPPSEVERESATHSAHPCSWLERRAPAGTRFCVQEAGEVMIFEYGLLHATCNLHDFDLAVGGQGHVPEIYTSLDRALHRGDVETARELLASQKEAQRILTGRRPHPWMFKIRGEHTTAMVEAAANGYDSIVQLLAENRASVMNAPDGTNPLVMAAGKSHVSTVGLLIRLRADVNAQEGTNERGTALTLAVHSGDANMTEFLISHGAKVNSKAGNGIRPVHMASGEGQREIFWHLIEHRAKVEVKDNELQAPVHKAAMNGHAGLLACLVSVRADVNDVDGGKNTPAHLAVQGGHSRALQFLADVGAALNAGNNIGARPLHLAVGSQQPRLADVLIGARVNVDARFSQGGGYSSMMIAAQEGHMKMVKWLLGQRADLHLADNAGAHALHHAALSGQGRVVNWLLSHRASAEATDRTGRQAYSFAKQGGHKMLARQFRTVAKGKVDAVMFDAGGNEEL